MGKFSSMAKVKSFELMVVILIIFFQQFAVAQTPNPVTANPNSPSKPEVAAEAEPFDTKFSPQEKNALVYLNQVNFRELDRIKWPDDPNLEGPSKVKYQDLEDIKTASEKISISLQNCKKLVAQYENEIQASYGIKKGTIPEFEVICELIGVSLKRIKLPNHPVFNVIGPFVLNKLDAAFFRYIESPEHERAKIYQKSIMGMLRLPVKYASSVFQVLIVISLALNGFLIFKVLS